MNVCPSDCLFLNLNKCVFEGKVSLTMVTLILNICPQRETGDQNL